jgi:hypothetical protein
LMRSTTPCVQFAQCFERKPMIEFTLHIPSLIAGGVATIVLLLAAYSLWS